MGFIEVLSMGLASEIQSNNVDIEQTKKVLLQRLKHAEKSGDEIFIFEEVAGASCYPALRLADNPKDPPRPTGSVIKSRDYLPMTYGILEKFGRVPNHNVFIAKNQTLPNTQGITFDTAIHLSVMKKTALANNTTFVAKHFYKTVPETGERVRTHVEWYGRRTNTADIAAMVEKNKSRYNPAKSNASELVVY